MTDDDERAMLDEAAEIALVINGLSGDDEWVFNWPVDTE
jgi:hypothetical protein